MTIEVNRGSLAKLESMVQDVLTVSPAAIQGAIINYLFDVTDGKVTLVDPTNPFIFLMESSAVTVAAGLEHSDSNLNKRYAVLANNVDELYLHMSDEDYLDRFAQPVATNFTFSLQYTSFVQNSIEVPDTQYRMVSFPKDTSISVNGITYTLEHEVEVRIYDNKTVKVIINTRGDVLGEDLVNTNVVPVDVINSYDGERRIIFNLDLFQLEKKAEVFNVVQSTAFKYIMDFNDLFHKASVYRRVKDEWTPMRVTHTDQVFDTTIPTALLQVKENSILVFIPPSYILDGQVSGEVKVIIESTKGLVSFDFSKFSIGDFSNVLEDHDRDLSVYNKATRFMSYAIFSGERVDGGRSSLSFPELKSRFIRNTIGVNELPVTPSHLSIDLEDTGYSSILHEDNLTGRTYIVSNEPVLRNNLPFLTGVNTTFIRITTTLNTLRELDTVTDNSEQITILPSTLYQIDPNGVNVTILDNSLVEELKNSTSTELKNLLDNVSYRYSPFSYVIDFKDGLLESRVYQFNRPAINNSNFFNVNTSITVFMNTESANIEYTDEGYLIRLITKADKSLDDFDADEIFVQMSFLPTEITGRVFLEASSIRKEGDNQFVTEFFLPTKFRMNDDNEIEYFPVLTSEGVEVIRRLPLKSKVDIVYGTTRLIDTYVRSDIDSIVLDRNTGRSLYTITHEELTFTVGTELEHLWRKAVVLSEDVVYETYDEDVPLKHDSIVVADNGRDFPFTMDSNCKVIYDNIGGMPGDDVLDQSGDIVYKHRKGDIVIDDNGLPVELQSSERDFKLDLMCFNGLFYFADEDRVNDYLIEVEKHIVEFSTTRIKPVLDRLLEKTSLFYKPKDSLGLARVAINEGESVWINKNQNFTVTLYVENSIFINNDARKLLERSSIPVIDKIIKRKIVTLDDISTALKLVYGDGVISVHISGLGNFNKEQSVLSLERDFERLSISKKAVVSNDNKLSIEEDVIFNFVKYVTT